MLYLVGELIYFIFVLTNPVHVINNLEMVDMVCFVEQPRKLLTFTVLKTADVLVLAIMVPRKQQYSSNCGIWSVSLKVYKDFFSKFRRSLKSHC